MASFCSPRSSRPSAACCCSWAPTRRIVAFILSGETAFAYFMGHAPRSFYPIANQGEAAVLFCFIFLYIAFAGGGPWSVDRAVLKQD